MGREIRRVPIGWKHPEDENGHLPLYDETYADALAEWERGLAEWLQGEHEQQKEPGPQEPHTEESYRQWWGGVRPVDKNYRPEFGSEPTAYQVYETVSEGTPVSPVFGTKEELLEWLQTDMDMTYEAATKFFQMGSVPSLMLESNPATGERRIKTGIEALEDTI